MAIRGYPGSPSVRPGETLKLHISTDAPAFRVRFFRVGPRLELCGQVPVLKGCWRPPGPADQDWAWPVYSWEVPSALRSGVYIASLEELTGDHGSGDPVELQEPEPPDVDARSGRLLFVVRSHLQRRPAPILYKVPLATYHAYNATGGASFYVGRAIDRTGRSRVTLQRPGGGTGGDLSFPHQIDAYDPATPREGLAHWDLPFIMWLEGAGYEVDYTTDVDVHADPKVLHGYRLLLSVGHDEYWSQAMRDRIEQFAAGGGNVAFFAGNVCFWRVEFDPACRSMSCMHPPVASPDCDQWWRIRPENSLTGVGYRGGGGWWTGPRDPLGYTVEYADHWVFAGSGLEHKQEFGGDERLVGYECDGALLDAAWPGPARPSTVDGTPADFEVLAVAPLSSRWQDRPAGAGAAATMGLHRPGGTVFTAATTDWSRLLAAGHPVVDRITRTVLDALQMAPAVLRAPGYAAASGTVHLLYAGDGSEDPSTIRWWSSAGELDASGTSATLVLPSDRRRVSVTVMVESPEGRRFGHATIWVLSARNLAQLKTLEIIRELALDSPPAPVPTLPAGHGNRPLCDPCWDPLIDGLRRPLEPSDAGRIRRLALELSETVCGLDAFGPQSGS